MALTLQASEGTGLDRRLRFLIWTRVAIAAVLMGATVVFQPGGREETVFGQSTTLAMLAVTSAHLLAGLAFAFLFAVRRIQHLALFTFVQLTWDLLFATALVAITGGIESEFWFLYFLTILNAAFLLFRPGAYLAAALSGIFYATLVNLQYFSRIPAFLNLLGEGPGWQENKVIASIVIKTVWFFAAAYASSWIAATYRETETKLARKSLEVEDLEDLMVRIVESLTDGLATLDAQGRVNYWNGTAEEITLLPGREVQGRPFPDLFPESRGILPKEGGAAGEPERPRRWEAPFRRRDGEERTLGFSVTSLRHGRESEGGRLIMFQDLTSVRDLEERVRRADRLAAVGELAARMAHEIRNPLTSVSGAIEVLKSRSSSSEEDRKLMEIVVRETDRLNQLLTDFLMYARPTAPQYEEVAADRLVRETAELFSKSLSDERVRLSIQVDPDVALWGDSKRIGQMLWNLLKNASESMDARGGEIRVELRNDPGRGEVRLEVRDEGPGISSDVRSKMFQPFFTTKNRGNGLGLAVVHRIAEEHRGSVAVESPAEGGALFRVTFPGPSGVASCGGA